MARRVTRIACAALVTGALWLAGAGSGLAQAAAEAAAAGAASASAGRAAGTAGQAIGAALGQTGARVKTYTRTATPAASSAGTKRTQAQGAASGAIQVSAVGSGIGTGSATFTVAGPAPQIHFDVVSFKRCAGAGPSEVDLPADGDSIAYHCQPVSRLISFAYAGGTAANVSLRGCPPWVESDLYDFVAQVADEDIDTWDRMALNARRVAVRPLLAKELQLKIHVDATPNPGNAEAAGMVVDHIERPAAD